jgi:O-antigen/teichoic acid export membrane protein
MLNRGRSNILGILINSVDYEGVSADLVPYFLGPDYGPTSEALRWLAILPVLKAMHYFLSETLTGSGYQSVRTSMQACVAAFNVLLNLWVIRAYGWRGATWSSIASDAALMLGIGAAVLVLSTRSSQHDNRPIAEPECG